MFDQVSPLFPGVVWATLLLSTAFCIAAGLISITRCRSWRIHRLTWLAVLSVGVLALFPILRPLEIAVLEPENISSNKEPEVQRSETSGFPRYENEEFPSEATSEFRFTSFGALDLPAQNLSHVSEFPSREAAKTQAAWTNFSWGHFISLLGLLWFVGIVLLPLRWFYQSVRFHRFLNEDILPTEPDADWSKVWNRLQTERGVKRPIPLLVAEHFGPALTWHPGGSALVVPLEGWDRLSDAERESVMRHELEHFIRNDILKTFLVRLLALPHWFNPLCWAALRRFEDAAEWACDEAALVQPNEETEQTVSTFARALVSLHETSMQDPRVFGPETALQHHIFGRNISNRVTRLLTFNIHQQRDSIMKKIFLLTVCVLLVCAAFVQVRLVAKDAEQANNEPGTVSPDKPLSPQLESHGDKVWEFFGIRYGEMSKELWKVRAENHFDKFPHGGILVTETKNDGLFHRLGVRKGDMIVGFYEWCVTSQNDLSYIIKAWPYRSGPTRLMLIRGDQLYYVDIPDDRRPRETTTLQVVKDGETVGELKLLSKQEPGQNLRGLTPPAPNAPAREAVKTTAVAQTEAEVKERLEMRVDLELDENMTFDDLFKFVMEKAKIQMLMDNKSVGALGITTSTPAVREPLRLSAVPLRQALRLCLEQQDLAYEIDEGVLIVLDQSEAHNRKEEAKAQEEEARQAAPPSLWLAMLPKEEIDENYLQLVAERLRIAHKDLKRKEQLHSQNALPEQEVEQAKLKFAETEYELKRVQKILRSPETQSPAHGASKKELTFQGKTFDQWVEELKTELDPKMRAEAFRAIAMFGANGRGKEATAVIVDAVKNISFQRMGAAMPIQDMKSAAVAAFADNDIRISFADSMPVLLKNLVEGTPNEQTFASQVFWSLTGFNRDKHEALKEFRPKMIDLLKRWEPTEFGDRRFQCLFHLVKDVFPESDVAAEMIREAVENEDEKRFTALFAGFEPMKMTAPSLFKGTNKACLFGIYPDVAEPDRGTNPVNLKPEDLKHFHLTLFGKSLLKLLQEKGVTAKNETIRETSKKVVEALLSVDKTE